MFGGNPVGVRVRQGVLQWALDAVAAVQVGEVRCCRDRGGPTGAAEYRRRERVDLAAGGVAAGPQIGQVGVLDPRPRVGVQCASPGSPATITR